MQEKLLEWKAGVAVFLYAVAELLGWKGLLLLAWVCAMALDYISGTMAACKAGEWSSGIARTGIYHKGSMLLVVMASGMLDMVMALGCNYFKSYGIYWPGIVLPLVVSWYVLTELGSVLENAVKWALPCPHG